MAAHSPHQHLRFGSYLLDPVAKVLFREGQPVTLTRKAVETLHVLLEHAGEVVTKEELMAAIWPDRVVDEANLTQNIAVLRKSLNAARGEAGHIETFPARGYRVEGPVQRGDLPLKRHPIWGWTTVLLLVLAGMGGWWWTRRAPAELALRYQASALTRLPGKEVQPALSPDGNQIAFLNLDERAPGPVLYVGRVGGQEPQRVSPAGIHASSPAWSPDGRSLAYLELSRDATHLAFVNLGTMQRRVGCSWPQGLFGEESRLLDWSPTGASIALVHAEKAAEKAGIFLADVNTCQLRRLTTPNDAVRLDSDPRFWADGKTLSFIRSYHRLRSEIFAVPLAGGEPRALTNFAKPITSHDCDNTGRAVFYAVNIDGAFNLFRLELKTGKAESLAVASVFPLQVAHARASSLLAYAPLSIDRNIWSFDLSSRQWVRRVATTAQDASPRVAPDGKRLLFRSDRSGREQLYIANADGSNVAKITDDAQRASVGSWSPDGRSVVFNDPLTQNIFIATEASLGRWSTRKTGMLGIHPVFAPSGNAVITAGNGKLQRWPLEGGEAELLAGTRAMSLSVDPAGEFLYFVKDPNDGVLWRMNLKTKSVGNVLEGIVPGCTSCWAVGEAGVYFLSATERSLDQQQLRFFKFGGPSVAIADYPEPLWPEGSGPFSLSPDRRTLYTVRLDPASNGDLVLLTPLPGR